VNEPGAPAQEAEPPVLRIVRGVPGPAELAALVAVLSARTASGAAAPQEPPSAWTDRRRASRTGTDHGPGSWRASSWPR
jgi:hypothetical protein